MITGSKELIRDINNHLVLEAIVNNSPLSRAALSKQLGLTKATISTIVQELLDNHLILEIGSKDTKKGRKPILLTFNQNCGQIISLDIGSHFITLLTSNLKGENCEIKQHPIDWNNINLLEVLKSIIKNTLDSLPATKYGVVGASIGIHGVVYNNKVTFLPYHTFELSDISLLLENEFNIAFSIENEANLSVLGEKAFLSECSSMINLSIHNGIGMGIIIDDILYTGANGYAGEFGHTIIMPYGRDCPCGNKGCFEQYASETALLLDFAARKNLNSVTIDELIRFYYKKDEDALSIVQEFITYMSIGINNILNTFNPDLIIINSSFTTYLPSLTEDITSALNNRMNHFCRIIPSKLQDTAGLLGGAYICAKKFLGIENLSFNA